MNKDKDVEIRELLLPCPFCGSSNIDLFEYENHWHVECESCGVDNGGWTDKSKSIECWNRRLSPWISIDSAPKDGTPILVYEPPAEYSDGGVLLVQWRSSIDHYPGSKPFWAWCLPESDQDEQGGCATIDHPTHWMPLPEPPKIDKKVSEE